MNTWCTYTEYLEEMEKQLQKELDLERSIYFKWSCRALSFKYDYIGNDGINLMLSINSKRCKRSNYYVVASTYTSYNKQIMKRYANK